MVAKSPKTLHTPNVVVVDPRFESYHELVARSREGRINLHMRSSGQEGLALASRRPVDAWLVAADLDDMSGLDFVELLRSQLETSKATDHDGGQQRVAIVSEKPGCPGHWEASEHGADHSMVKPISMSDLESFLEMTPAERELLLPGRDLARSILTLPVSMGAAVVALAVVMLG
jgi:DNA-binding response OmpR family regulator